MILYNIKKIIFIDEYTFIFEIYLIIKSRHTVMKFKKM